MFHGVDVVFDDSRRGFVLSFPANPASYCLLHHTHPSCNVMDLKLCLWSTADSSRTLRTARLIGRCAPSQSRSSILGAVDHLRSSLLQHGPDSGFVAASVFGSQTPLPPVRETFIHPDRTWPPPAWPPCQRTTTISL